MDISVEKAYLSRVIGVINNQIKEIEQFLSSIRENVESYQSYVWETRGEASELEQNSMRRETERQINVYSKNQKALRRLTHQYSTPYFGKITFSGPEITEDFYIGTGSVIDSFNPLVIDWRSNIGAMYYNFDTGKAWYYENDLITGEKSKAVSGVITEKCQFSIKNGEILYVSNIDEKTREDYLTSQLSLNAKDRSANIAATIQIEQNRVIRADYRKNVIVQGVAGSGKTAIAIHRAAYLLYNLGDSLTSQDIVIISPGGMFSDFISGILPSLGEDEIREITLDEIGALALGNDFHAQERYKYIEQSLVGGSWSAGRSEFKGSMKFVELMKDYVAKRAEEIYHPKDILLSEDGSLSSVITVERLSTLYSVHFRANPPVKRIAMIEDYVREQAESVIPHYAVKKREQDRIERELNSFKSYGTLLSEYNNFLHSLRNMGFPAGRDATYKLRYEDLFPIILFKLLFWEQINDYRSVKHLIVDEMQDYSPVQYAVINSLFRCPKTILGDMNQQILPCSGIRDIDTLLNIYADNSVYVNLTRAYRSTYEIMDYAAQFLDEDMPNYVTRHGNAPKEITYSDLRDEARKIADETDRLSSKYDTVGIICRSLAEASKLYYYIEDKTNVKFISDPDVVYRHGVVITASHVAKGLEFDSVILADAGNYNLPQDRGLIYIAATRALHELTVFIQE